MENTIIIVLVLAGICVFLLWVGVDAWKYIYGSMPVRPCDHLRCELCNTILWWKSCRQNKRNCNGLFGDFGNLGRYFPICFTVLFYNCTLKNL